MTALRSITAPGHRTRHPAAVAALLWLGALLHAQPAAAEQQYWTYTVRPGDNIWNLTRTHCTSVRHWKRIQQLNNIELDRAIPPGTKLRFPLEILKHQPATARVARLHGKATLIRAGSDTREALRADSALRSGDRVITAAESNVTLHFADGSQLLVLGDSEVVMDSLSAWGTTGMVDTRVRLQGGRIDTRVTPAQGPGSRYRIITPSAVAAVRGTDFRVAADDSAALTRSEVTDGTVAVGGDAGSRDVPAGFGLVSEAGQPPQAPRPLLPAPRLASAPPILRQLPLEIAWPALPGALRYRFQIAPDAGFETLLADRVTDSAAAEWDDLPDGEYAIRVRGIDDVGLEGLDAVTRFEVDARPFAPLLQAPADGATLADATPSLDWTPHEHSAAWRLQLARDADFAEPLLEQTLDATQFAPAHALTPGSYHWRVAAVDDAGRTGPYSAPRSFRYRAPPGAVGTTGAQVQGRKLLIDWAPLAEAEHYRVELAEDPDFRHLVARHTVSEPRLELRRPPSRRYYLRVRAGAEGIDSGPWSAARQVDVPPYHYWPLLALVVPLLLLL